MNKELQGIKYHLKSQIALMLIGMFLSITLVSSARAEDEDGDRGKEVSAYGYSYDDLYGNLSIVSSGNSFVDVFKNTLLVDEWKMLWRAITEIPRYKVEQIWSENLIHKTAEKTKYE